MSYPISVATDSLVIEKIENHPVNSNCYLIRKKGANNCIIVDPSFKNYSLLEIRNIKLDYIILTHEHFDHIGSVQYLRRKYDCKVVSSVNCSANITNAKKNLSLFYDKVGFCCDPAEILIHTSHSSISWDGFDLIFILTPGHSEGGLCFSVENHLFTGDTIMNGYEPVVKLPGGNKAKLEESINTIVNTFSFDMFLYPGHGDQFQLSTLAVLNDELL
jgi:hydroxyacylglutathione hydrolase